jgi:HAMP domain-containing protein
MRRSIRFRITAVAFALTAGLLAIVSLLMAAVLRSQLIDNLDESIAQRADTIAAVVQRAPLSEIVLDEDLLVQVVGADGTIVGASPNLVGRPAITTLEPGPRTIHNVPGRPEAFRVLVQPTSVGTGAATLIVGINYDDVTDPMRILKKLLAFAVPSVLVVLGLLSWWLTGRMLRPVESIRSRMAAINTSNLAGRVPEPGNGDEIDRLAQTMNETLARLEDAVRRQQRFVADASHELRSPLTRMRGELELHLAHPGSSDPLDTERSVLTETVALQHLVDDLLELARADANIEPRRNDVVDLDDIVLHEVRRLAERGLVHVDTKRSRQHRFRETVSSYDERYVTCLTTLSGMRPAPSSSRSTSVMVGRYLPLETTVSASPPLTGLSYSIDSRVSMKRGPATKVGAALGWPSRATSLFDTAARFASPTGRRPSS